VGAVAGFDGGPRRILIVEDEWLVAASLADRLRDLGHEVIGPAPDVEKGLRLIANGRPDAALLDVSLATEKSFPVAAALRREGVPFAFLTGYVTVDLPAEFASETVLNKPVADPILKAALGRLFGRS
jgi:DNA-binding response OmpR family regulator